jgi:hypothetical protein
MPALLTRMSMPPSASAAARDRRAHRRVVGHVGDEAELGIRRRRGVEVQHRDPRSALGQQVRGGQADAGAAPGDDGVKAGKFGRAHAVTPSFTRRRSSTQNVPSGYRYVAMDSACISAEKPGAVGAWYRAPLDPHRVDEVLVQVVDVLDHAVLARARRCT